MIIFDTDTASVCTRNKISDVTFYDSTSFIFKIESQSSDRFPVTFIERNIKFESESRDVLLRELKEGEPLPAIPFSNDFVIFAVMTAVLLYAFISSISRSYFHEMRRFFLFRGIGEPASRDLQSLFHWQSTIINLVSFLNIGLFGYCVADYFEFIPGTIPGFIFWLICIVAVIVIISFRHVLCYIVGNASNQTETFNEYIITIYLSYRYGALILFMISVLILYSGLADLKLLFLTGMIVSVVVYLIRVIRLFMIFIRRSISIFYLILYLCALEFLPVAVLFRYLTGLF